MEKILRYYKKEKIPRENWKKRTVQKGFKRPGRKPFVSRFSGIRLTLAILKKNTSDPYFKEIDRKGFGIINYDNVVDCGDFAYWIASQIEANDNAKKRIYFIKKMNINWDDLENCGHISNYGSFDEETGLWTYFETFQQAKDVLKRIFDDMEAGRAQKLDEMFEENKARRKAINNPPPFNPQNTTIEETKTDLIDGHEFDDII